jgi:hypothetical protein
MTWFWFFLLVVGYVLGETVNTLLSATYGFHILAPQGGSEVWYVIDFAFGFVRHRLK